MVNERIIVTIADSNYFPSVAISAMQASKFHPESAFIVYDWGLKSFEKVFLRNHGARIVDWQSRFVELPIPSFSIPKRIRSIVKSDARTRSKLKLARDTIVDGITNKRRNREWLYAQKPYVLAHCSEHSPDGTILFLDGDAFLVNSIEEFFSEPSELKVTIRRKEEISFAFGYCRVINAGVIGIAGSENTRRKIISEWIKKMQELVDDCVEQTALTRLIYGKSCVAVPEEIRRVKMRQGSFKAKILECDTYNYNWIEEGVNPDKNKIVHFKGGRHNEENFFRLSMAVGLSEEVEVIKDLRRSEP